MRNFSIRNTIWKNRGHEFDNIVDNIFLHNVRYYIYGENDENDRLINRMVGRNVTVAERIEDIAVGETVIVICTFSARKKYEEAVKHFVSIIGSRNLGPSD